MRAHVAFKLTPKKAEELGRTGGCSTLLLRLRRLSFQRCQTLQRPAYLLDIICPLFVRGPQHKFASCVRVLEQAKRFAEEYGRGQLNVLVWLLEDVLRMALGPMTTFFAPIG